MPLSDYPIQYQAKAGSPYTTTTASFTSGDTTISLALSSQLPAAPNLVCLEGAPGSGVFLYTGIAGNNLTGVTQVEGPTGTWPVGSYAFRGFTAYDHNGLVSHSYRGSIPSFKNHIFRITDGASPANNLEIHMVWIPFFKSAGFSQPNLNNLLLGGFWVDKYQACQPGATATSDGGLTKNNPGSGVGASCKPHVVPWTEISWNTAKTVLENRGGTANKCATTACATVSGGSYPKSEFLVSNISHLVGRRVEIVQDSKTYYRRIIKVGKAAEPKYVRVYPDLPDEITTDDTYTIIGHHMISPDEWFALAAWATTFRYQHGLGYPKGNNDYGKDYEDTRSVEYEGLIDPVIGGDATNDKRRCLTGSGPASWSLNGRDDGVWDLNGNVWEWVFQKVVTDGTNIAIAEGFPGQGVSISPSGTSGQKITAMYDTEVPVDGLSINPDVCLPTGISSGGSPEFGYDGFWFNKSTNTYAAIRGGDWYYGLSYGVWAVGLGYVPTDTRNFIGFRGAF